MSVGEAFFPLDIIPNFLKYKIVYCILGLRLGNKTEHLIEKKGAKKPPTTMKYAGLNKNCKACFHSEGHQKPIFILNLLKLKWIVTYPLQSPREKY